MQAFSACSNFIGVFIRSAMVYIIVNAPCNVSYLMQSSILLI